MNRRCVVFIGLDGVGLDAMKIFLKYMPYLKRIVREYPIVYVDTVPPYTPPIWTSMVTGVNPGKHSVMGFTRVSRSSNGFRVRVANACDVKYPRIWEILAFYGMKSLVINYPLTYPVEAMYLRDKVVLISGWDSPSIQFYPKELFINRLRTVIAFRFMEYEYRWKEYLVKNRVSEYLDKLARNTMLRLEEALNLFKKLKLTSLQF